MSNEARGDVVAVLTRLAQSTDYRDRADAGRALASFADVPAAHEPLQRLLLDPNDTFVTRATAEALLRRQDTAGLVAVASALTKADFNQMAWIHTAVRDVFGVFASERDTALGNSKALTRDYGMALQCGVDQLREMLIDINPVLYPADEPDPRRQ
ncbi:HEAT repeat domain-containing protein [Actinoplanes sp. DH11]|uniref:HEAT repeat domain-containing protein n=1 Tax=Actinoplanes sp. DH11 TaxID=2857011 RepID=UPI001E3EE16E|nr:HEAT repeat domain-containing protein [Actinoplanes sp. DH11]